MSRVNRLALTYVAWFALACTPKIDGASKDGFKSSVEKIGASLAPDDLKKFQAAVAYLALRSASQSIFGGGNADDAESKIRSELGGKTAPEVIAAVEKMKVEDEQRRVAAERKRTTEEIAKLEATQKESDDAKASLAKFVVTKAKFHKVKHGFMTQPVLELSVENKTGKPISRAYFHGVLTSPGRSVPWLSEDFNHEIPGGVEPGEKKNWELAPNMFSAWGKVEEQAGMQLTATVSRLDGADGEMLWESRFNDKDIVKLRELREKLTKIAASSLTTPEPSSH